jgi:gliding motility-associated-like protein
MVNPSFFFQRWLMMPLFIIGQITVLAKGITLPPPVNDNCSNAIPIAITNNGFDYGVFTSETSDLTMATSQTGEYFAESGHTKSVWFQFTLPTSRSYSIVMGGSNLDNVAVTVYEPANCPPQAAFLTGTLLANGGGDISNSCSDIGIYRVQVSGPPNSLANVNIVLTLSCPTASTALYDCPSDAFVFNNGNPLTQIQSSTGNHDIECQSIEQRNETDCLPVPVKTDYLKSTWYVFTTGPSVDLLIFYFGIGSAVDRVGYRLFEGNVRSTSPDLLPMIDCGAAVHDNHTRHIEFPCILKPNTTYSISLLFHKNLNRVINISAQQRGVSATGWPAPVLPPAIASNQLGTLPESPAGATTVWSDRFDCSSFIIDNPCPPANPNSGTVVVGGGINANTYDLATWATFTLAEDAHVTIRLTSPVFWGEFHTRIFNRTINAACPSPSTSTDLYYQFSGRAVEILCMPPGDYAIQVLSSSSDPNTQGPDFDEAWTFGVLGTEFSMEFEVVALPSIGLFRLDAPDSYNPINNLNALQEDVTYFSTPAVLICENTVIPSNVTCPNMEKAIYREALIGDGNGDAQPDSGLLTIRHLRTDIIDSVQLVYSFLQGDANALATAAGTHAGGQIIPGMVNYPGFCIDQDDNTPNPAGIDSMCVCVTPGTYTLASLGNIDHVGLGDAPEFKFDIHRTIHDSRPKAEEIILGPVPGSYASNTDMFSCADNLGNMPPCGRRKKLVFREFYLADSALVTITDIGSAGAFISLFEGQASDPGVNLAMIIGCVPGIVQLYDPCNPLPPGWYTVVSYGEGPNYTDTRVWNTNINSLIDYQGDPRDVGQTSRIVITLEPPIIPNYNRPDKAFHAGTTDWTTIPAGNPNANSGRVYAFPRDTFCLPDTPFIPLGLLPCAPGYNRVSFYVFSITKPSFVQIRNINNTYFTEVFPFDVTADPDSLLTVPPVYQCLSENVHYRQICDLPPGIYTIAIFANDSHEGLSIGPAIYVEEAALSRFDHAWNAYDFDQIPITNTFVDGKLGDIPPIPNQAPSRDKFYCTTGATNIDPAETQCATQLNPLIYAQPPGVPKPLYLPGQPPAPVSQPWRNLWYTFELSGSGVCTIESRVLSGSNFQPFLAVYESDLDASIPWSSLQTVLMDPMNTIIPGLRLLDENVNEFTCDIETGNVSFIKSGCIRDSVRYFIVASFDADDTPNPPIMPNQAISISIKYDGKPTFIAAYDERTTANVVNGLVETMPPYTNIPLTNGSEFVSPDFSLLCYTPNITDPTPAQLCFETGKSAWFKFEVTGSGQLYTALEKREGTPGWHADASNVSLWKETSSGMPLTQEIPLTAQFVQADNHSWLRGCIDPGTYYLMVRHCETSIDTIQAYRVVMRLTDPPGDFCSNAIPIVVPGFLPVTGTVFPDCHTIGTDFGEQSNAGLGCLFEPIQQKTSWFKVTVTAGPKTDITFQLTENLTNANMSELSYRIFVGSCGALTPIACSSLGSNIITQRCLAPGDYYVQIAMPENSGITPVSGSIDLTITVEDNTDPDCFPVDVNQPLADFTYITDCETVTFNNVSTGGTDITYLWEFPDGTSTDPNPVWIPAGGFGTYPVTLTVTNTVSNTTASITVNVVVSNTFTNYTPLTDEAICNDATSLTVDVTVPGPGVITYLWDNNTVNPVRTISAEGTYWVRITKDGCEIRDTFTVTHIDARRNVAMTLCPEEGVLVAGQWFDSNNPSGMITLPQAHPSGCDSLINVNLDFHSPAGSQFGETICEGETFMFGGQSLAVSGTYTDTLSSSFGCDSVVTLTLAVTPRTLHDYDVSGCLGEKITLKPAVSGTDYTWNTTAITDSLVIDQAGQYEVSVSDANGCLISVETFNVVLGLLAAPIATNPEPICTGEDVLVVAGGSIYDYRWYDANFGGNLLGQGPSLMLSDVLTDMIVYVEAFNAAIAGCISMRVPVFIEVIEENLLTETSDTLICPGEPVILPWGEVVNPNANASYSYTWPSSLTGCDSLFITVNIDVETTPSLSLPTVFTMQLGDSVLLIPQLDFQPDSIAWTPVEGLSCTNCLQPWAKPIQTTEYELTLWTASGCIVSAIVRIEVDNELKLYFPNVFSPNGDGINDQFNVSGRQDLFVVESMKIYDRWGGLLWEERNYIADGTNGWDGTSRGQTAPAGVYVWMCEIQRADGTSETYSGDVTLVR